MAFLDSNILAISEQVFSKESSIGTAKRNRPSQKLDWVAPLVADTTDATSPLGYSNPFKYPHFTAP